MVSLLRHFRRVSPANIAPASESDDTIVGVSNRGRKLKRKAKYVHEGKLDDGLGVNGYKEVRVGMSQAGSVVGDRWPA